MTASIQPNPNRINTEIIENSLGASQAANLLIRKGYRLAIKTFDTLDPDLLYALLSLRQEVFIVEQNCAYQDCDGLDQTALHLLLFSDKSSAGSSVDTAEQELQGYARITTPNTRFDEPGIGRVIIAAEQRRQRLGLGLMQVALDICQAAYPGQDIKISAQVQLAPFYTNLGFAACSEPYDEDGIEHICMRYGNNS